MTSFPNRTPRSGYPAKHGVGGCLLTGKVSVCSWKFANHHSLDGYSEQRMSRLWVLPNRHAILQTLYDARMPETSPDLVDLYRAVVRSRLRQAVTHRE
jgi:hypothetical protein